MQRFFPTLLRGDASATENDESGKGLRRAHTLETMAESGSTPSGDEGSAPIARSKTVPGITSTDLGAEYPVELKVCNTFLHFPKANRPESWDDCLALRQVRSAPGSRQFDEHGPGGGCTVPEETEEPRQARAVLDLSSMLSKQFGMSTAAPPPTEPRADGYYQSCSQQMLYHKPEEPKLGSLDIPTVGSAAHDLGQCKPCAFVWKGDGCSNGVQCPFCHLCDPGEKKRRAKDKKMHIRSQRTNNCGGGQGFSGGRLQQTFRNMFS